MCRCCRGSGYGASQVRASLLRVVGPLRGVLIPFAAVKNAVIQVLLIIDNYFGNY